MCVKNVYNYIENELTFMLVLDIITGIKVKKGKKEVIYCGSDRRNYQNGKKE